MFTSTIFETEKKAIEFKDKQKSMRKKHDCRVVEFDYKYFKDWNVGNLQGQDKLERAGLFSRTGLGAAAASLGGRAISGLSPRTQQAVTGVVSGANALRVASKLFFW